METIITGRGTAGCDDSSQRRASRYATTLLSCTAIICPIVTHALVVKDDEQGNIVKSIKLYIEKSPKPRLKYIFF
jgi:hypothetical protein